MTAETKNPEVGKDGLPLDASTAGRRFEDLPPAAQRALKEAEARRELESDKPDSATEIGGRGGKDPVRFGDWEIDGRAIDF